MKEGAFAAAALIKMISPAQTSMSVRMFGSVLAAAASIPMAPSNAIVSQDTSAHRRAVTVKARSRVFKQCWRSCAIL